MEQKIIAVQMDVAVPHAHSITLGSLSVLYESGALRNICWNNHEIVQMIYVAVRDKKWLTLQPQITEEVLDCRESSFRISYKASYSKQDICFQSNMLITGDANGEVKFFMEGKALSTFLKNRIGLCVHLPPSGLVNQPAELITMAGEREVALFPDIISPYQPMVHMSTLKWNAWPAQCELEFTGDVFEMEDQRNWGDASFKIYSTPLAEEYPVEVLKGDRTDQAIQLKIHNQILKLPERADHGKRMKFPLLGITGDPQRCPLNKEMIGVVKELSLNYYQLGLDIRKMDWEERLSLALHEASQLNLKITLTVWVDHSDNEVVATLLSNMITYQEQFYSVLPLSPGVSVADPSLITKFSTSLKSITTIKIGYGTDISFAEVNRARTVDVQYDFISFPHSPQVHASDTRSIIQNLENVQDIVRTARSIWGNIEVAVGPVSLHARKHPDTTTTTVIDPDFPPDKRQTSQFAAFWTVAMIAGFAGADSVCINEIAGPAGIIDAGGYPTPTFNLLRQVLEFEPLWVIQEKNIQNVTLENIRGERLLIRLESIHP